MQQARCAVPLAGPQEPLAIARAVHWHAPCLMQIARCSIFQLCRPVWTSLRDLARTWHIHLTYIMPSAARKGCETIISRAS
jgi:hypothetical protein